MTKTIYTNKTTGERLEFVNKEGQLYTLKNSNNEEVEIYRIVLAKHYNKTEEEEIVEAEQIVFENEREYIDAVEDEVANIIAAQEGSSNNEQQVENITTRKNVKHKEIKVVSPKGEDLTFESIKAFSEYLENELCKRINKGHLYNLVNGKSKSYLGYKVVQ